MTCRIVSMPRFESYKSLNKVELQTSLTMLQQQSSGIYPKLLLCQHSKWRWMMASLIQQKPEASTSTLTLVTHQHPFSNYNNVHLPYNLHLSGTFRLFLLPCWVVPVQLVEQNHQSWYQVQVFMHPSCFQDAFGDVPLIGSPLHRQTENNW